MRELSEAIEIYHTLDEVIVIREKKFPNHSNHKLNISDFLVCKL